MSHLTVTSMRCELALHFGDMQPIACCAFSPDYADMIGLVIEDTQPPTDEWLQARGWVGHEIPWGYMLQPASAFAEDAAAAACVQAAGEPEKRAELSVDAIGAALALAFPTLKTRPLAEYGGRWAHQPGYWTGGNEATMPDGVSPIFYDLALAEWPYDGCVHRGFIAWLEARGWYYERDDAMTILLVPNSYFQEPAEGVLS